MKKKLLAFGIIVLVVINISALATIAYNHWFKSEESHAPPHRMHPFAYLRDELSLDESQVAQFRALRDLFEERIGEAQVKLRERRRTLMEELRADAPDSVRIDGLVDEIGMLQSELQKQAIRHMLREQATLTPEQRERFLSMLDDHASRRGMMQRRGRVGKGGPRWRSFQREE